MGWRGLSAWGYTNEIIKKDSQIIKEVFASKVQNSKIGLSIDPPPILKRPPPLLKRPPTIFAIFGRASGQLF